MTNKQKKPSARVSLNALQLSDIYSLMLFILYKIQDIPEYATLSEICYLLDQSSVTKLITYFAGKTIKIPSATEFVILSEALLLYDRVNVEGMSLIDAQNMMSKVSSSQRTKILAMYLKIIPEISKYNINRSLVAKDDR